MLDIARENFIMVNMEKFISLSILINLLSIRQKKIKKILMTLKIVMRFFIQDYGITLQYYIIELELEFLVQKLIISFIHESLILKNFKTYAMKLQKMVFIFLLQMQIEP